MTARGSEGRPRKRVSGSGRAREVALRWFAAFAVGVFASVASAAQVDVRDDRGAMVSLPAPPTRIVSLLPSLTESVCALGGCGRLVGTDRFSNWPASVASLPKLGGLDDAQIERIA